LLGDVTAIIEIRKTSKMHRATSLEAVEVAYCEEEKGESGYLAESEEEEAGERCRRRRHGGVYRGPTSGCS
jgi:hypothetical protein